MPTLPLKRYRKQLTAKNVLRDVKETAYDIRDEPEEVAYRIRERVRDYQDDDRPDINKPVPLPNLEEDRPKRGLRYVRLRSGKQ